MGETKTKEGTGISEEQSQTLQAYSIVWMVNVWLIPRKQNCKQCETFRQCETVWVRRLCTDTYLHLHFEHHYFLFMIHHYFFIFYL